MLFRVLVGVIGVMPPLAAQVRDTTPCIVQGAVVDREGGQSLPDAQISLSRSGRVIARRSTDRSGSFVFRDLLPAVYRVETRHIGFATDAQDVLVDDTRPGAFVAVSLRRIPTALNAVMVVAAVPVAIDPRSGDQSYLQRLALAAPSTATSQLLQQAVAGAARAPTGEVHFRGQHAEYTYYVDGVPVPSGISGSLNEVLDPAVAERVDISTGGWDAEYGNKNIAVVNVETRIPDEATHWEASAHAGSFATHGGTVLISSANPRTGVLISLTHQATAMRREPVMFSARGAPLNFHNAGTDDYAFSKVEWRPSQRDRVNLSASASITGFAVPFDSALGVVDDHQRDGNSFLNVGWTRNLMPRARSWPGRRSDGMHELFAAAYVRHGSLQYDPGVLDPPVFVFFPDTANRYSVREQRSATTTGLRAWYSLPLNDALAIKTGLDASLVTGREDFETRDSLGRSGPTAHSGLRGGDVGVFAQAVLVPNVHWELRGGLRVDHHAAPLAGDEHQVSPRLRVAYLPNDRTSLWVYYGRLFIPSNAEDFHVLASAGQGGAVGLPTVPERDHYFEAGVVHHFAALIAKFTAYLRNNNPAVDDNTLPGTALTTTVNVAAVRVSGLEVAAAFDPGGGFSSYVNAALSHARAHGPITGGFFPTAYPSGWFDQDHDQRLSIVAGATYAMSRGYVGVTGIFGSGLTNGQPDAAPNETGLFAFNPAVKVAPSLILNAIAGSRFALLSAVVSPGLYIDNVFDRRYILKGAFTSGPSIGRPRSVQLRVKVEGR